MQINREYDFDDVLILPVNNSDTYSRNWISLAQHLGSTERGFDLKLPLIGSPMKGIMNGKLAFALGKAGAIGILHRFYDPASTDTNEWEKDISMLSGKVNFGVSVSLDRKDDSFIYALGEGANIVCIDIANGHLSSLLGRVADIADYIEQHQHKSLVMAGNVVSSNRVKELFSNGADLVRVGIGSGALCTTRNYTGIGRPQISTIMDCSGNSLFGKAIVADGGIRNSGDIVKALCAGANTVMVGSLLAKAKESAHNGIIYGMASRKLQEEYYHSVKSIEGLEVNVSEANQTVEELLDEIFWSVKSAFTYLNAESIKDAQANARFVEVGRSSIKEL